MLRQWPTLAACCSALLRRSGGPTRLLLWCGVASVSSAGIAQTPSVQEPTDIVVIGTRNKANADVESSLDETQIEGYATDSIRQLMRRIAPLIGGTDDQPVLIVNGKIIANPNEIERYPPEALKQVDVLTRDAAGNYGLPADKRVVNLVLKSRFKSYIAGFEARTIAGIDGDAETLSLQRVAVEGDDRWSADVSFNRAGSLLRSDRGMTSPTGDASIAGNLFGIDGQELDPALSAMANAPVLSAAVPASAGTRALTITDLLPGANEPTVGDDGRFRTLSPSTVGGSLDLSYTKTIGETSINLGLRARTQKSSQQIGLAGASFQLPAGSPFSPLANGAHLDRLFEEGQLDSDARTTSAGISASAVRSLLGVNTTLNLTYDRNDSKTLTDEGFDFGDLQTRLLAKDPSINPFGTFPFESPLSRRTVASSETWSGSLALRDTLKLLPAGPISWGVSATTQWGRSKSRTSSSTDGVVAADFSARQNNLRVDLSIPLTAEKAGALSFLGRTALNVAADFSAASGTHRRLGLSAGLLWAPSKAFMLTGMVNVQNVPPTNEQRFGPVLNRPNVGIFDYRSGELVYVTEITGGNPDLRPGRNKSLTFGLSATPFGSKGPRINVDYSSRISRNGIGALPTLSEIVESAFPERVLRSVDGRLISIDTRPLNSTRESQKGLRTSLNWRTTLPASDRELERQKSDPDRWKGPESIEISLRHEWALTNSLRIRAGLPELDRLKGQGGGEARHRIQAQVDLNLRGIGLSFDTVWQSAYRQLAGTDGPRPNDLRFGALFKTDLRINLYPTSFAFLKKSGLMKDTRITFTIDNLLDRRRNVARLDGTSLPGYSKYDLDPFGRTFKVSLRRRF